MGLGGAGYIGSSRAILRAEGGMGWGGLLCGYYVVIMWLLCGYSGILNCLAAIFVLLGSVAGCNGVETGFLQSLDGGFFLQTGMGIVWAGMWVS